MAEGLPATVYRPGIVVGDSKTGETQKYDGPYFVLRFLMKQPGSHVVPRSPIRTASSSAWSPRLRGRGHRPPERDAGRGRQDVRVDRSGRTDRARDGGRVLPAPGQSPHWVRVPLRLTTALVGLPGVEFLLGFPQEALPYFAHPTIYDTSEGDRDLARVDLACPPFKEYAETMVEFVKAHPDVPSAASVTRTGAVSGWAAAAGAHRDVQAGLGPLDGRHFVGVVGTRGLGPRLGGLGALHVDLGRPLGGLAQDLDRVGVQREESAVDREEVLGPSGLSTRTALSARIASTGS